MNSYTTDQISAARRALCNPYAHMELLEEGTDSMQEQPITPLSQYGEANSRQVHASRKLLQNQYSHLDGDGKFNGLVKSSNDSLALANPDPQISKPEGRVARDVKPINLPAPRRYSEKQIQNFARQIQVDIWNDRNRFWDGSPPKDPIELLSPAHGIFLEGYSLEHKSGFGPIFKDHDIAEIAGYLDNVHKKVYISEQFTLEQQLFTAAHELGHILMHRESLGQLHRDRPVDGATKLSRDYIEWAADKFATFFLMPENLVRSCFEQKFKAGCLTVTEEIAFGLGYSNADEFRKSIRNKRQFSQLVASTTHFHTSHFKSLASQFRVSVGAMTIRLEELELIKY